MPSLYNGFHLPEIGFGTFPQKKELCQSLPIALRCGYRLIDSSDNYCNEEFIGEVLSSNQDIPVIVVTKFSQPFRTFALRTCFEESRRKLGGRIDIYLLHWPFPFLWKIAWRAMEDLYLSGECKAIGVCNFERPMLKRLLRSCRVKPMINQFERHPLFSQSETEAFCRENGIVVMSYAPLARMDRSLFANSTLATIAETKKKSISQIVLRWNIEHKTIPIPASKQENHIVSNFRICDFSLSDEEVRQIDALEAGHRIRFDPKTRFDRKTQRRFLVYRLRYLLKSIPGLRRLTAWRRIVQRCFA